MTDHFQYSGEELDAAAGARNWKAYFGSIVAPHLTGRVLEVGAGIGGTTLHLRAAPQREWVCLEPDPELAERLRARLAENPSAVPTRVQVGTLEALDPSDRFDAIVYIDVLEHIEDDAGELRRAEAALAAGGAIVVLSPAFPFLFSEMDRAVGHFRRYTKRTLAAAFPPGMRKERLVYLDALGTVASVANKLLLKQAAPTRGNIAFWDRTIIPVSRVLDPLIGRPFGRSVLGVYRKSDLDSRASERTRS